jgi:hypothetical protein
MSDDLWLVGEKDCGTCEGTGCPTCGDQHRRKIEPCNYGHTCVECTDCGPTLETHDEWRSLEFTYLVPKDADVDSLETEMIEFCARVVGCDCTDDTEQCKADWFAVGGPVKEEYD